jgi:hypothetical protein
MAGYTYQAEDGLLQVFMQMQGFVAKYFQARAASCLRDHHVEWIDLDGKLKDWSRLATAVATAELRALALGRSGLRDDGARVLARCEGMGRLCALSLLGARLTPSGVAALCESEVLTRLVSLALPDTGRAPAWPRTLADGPLAGRLLRLDLRGSRLDDVGLGVLLNSRPLASALVSLNLAGCDLSDRAAGALATSAHLSALRSLDLSHNYLSDTAASLLAGSDLIRQLHRLRIVTLHGITPAGHAVLVRAAADFPGLTLVLDIGLQHNEETAAFREMLGDRLVLE